MTKITLELEDIKALASDSRLDILKILDGKKLNLQEITRIIKLNKATLHVHLTKLLEAGFIKKKKRSGHKWVYYSLTWKGECLLHPENTKIVVLFSIAFISFCTGIIQLINYAKGTIVGFAQSLPNDPTTRVYAVTDEIGIYPASQKVLQNVAEIPSQNQTIFQLSQALNQNATIAGLANNRFSDTAIKWSQSSQTIQDIIRETGVQVEGGEEQLFSPEAINVIAYVQDPTILYIGIIFLSIFIILFFFASWKLWVNRTQKI